MKQADNKVRGSTLVELFIALAFLSITSLMTEVWARSVIDHGRRQQADAESSEEVDLTLEMMAHEVRGTGFAATSAIDGIALATADRLELASDLDADGRLDSSNERIVYAYRASTGQLTRATGNGAGQPLVDGVPPDGFRFEYVDAAGSKLSPAAGGLDLAQRRAIRRIDVRLAVERQAGSTRARAEGAISVALRNRLTP